MVYCYHIMYHLKRYMKKVLILKDDTSELETCVLALTVHSSPTPDSLKKQGEPLSMVEKLCMHL